MIEAGLVKSHVVGRDGFVWWIGQIAPNTTWEDNQPAELLKGKKPTKEELDAEFDHSYNIDNKTHKVVKLKQMKVDQIEYKKPKRKEPNY